MRKRILCVLLAAMLLITLLPATVSAKLLPEIESNETKDEIAAGDAVPINKGTVITNNGLIQQNNGTVMTNNGTIILNAVTVSDNYGTIKDSNGDVVMNMGTIENNYDHVQENKGTVKHNFGDGVYLNRGNIEHQYYKFSVTGGENAEIIGAIKAASNRWIESVNTNSGYKITIKAKDGCRFASAPVGGNCIITKVSEFEYTVSGATGDVDITLKTLEGSERITKQVLGNGTVGVRVSSGNADDPGDYLVPGRKYNAFPTAGTGESLLGLYLVKDDNSLPAAPYSISGSFTSVTGGLGGYDFVCPNYDFTLYAVFSGEALTIDGGIGENEFVFYRGEQAPGYTFAVNPLPEGISDFTWSADGLPDGLTLTENTPESSVTITGTPTTLADVTDVKIKVSATDTAGKSHYGELTVKAVVEELYADVKTLVENAECTVLQETANTVAAVLKWLNETWLPALLEGKRLHEYEVYTVRASASVAAPFKAAVSGSEAKPEGVNGSLPFEVGMKLETGSGTGFEALTSGTATIKASAYVPACKHESLSGYIAASDGHYQVCNTYKAKVNYGKHQYDGISDHICSVCGYSSSLTITMPGLTSDEDLNKSVGIRFSPNDGMTVPAGASLSAQIYTPTKDDIAAAVTEGFSPNAEISDIKEYQVGAKDITILKSFTYQSTEYNIGDIVDYNSGEFLVCSFSAEHDAMYCTKLDYRSRVNYKFNSDSIPGQVAIGEMTDFNGNIKQTTPYMIKINGIAYRVKYEDAQFIMPTTYLYIYTSGNAPAGKVGIQTSEDGVSFIASAAFIKGCDPESLSKLPGNSIAPNGSFTSHGKKYLVYTVFSQDISVLDSNGEKVNVPGTMEFSNFPTVKGAVGYILMHSGKGVRKNQIEKTTYTANSDFSISLNTDHQSPFMIFAIVEDTVAETPVKTIEDTGDTESPQTGDSSNMTLWFTLLIISGVAVLTIGITKKKHRELN
ncbi:MAG: sortase B protein-sorting domain-containing protein [Clostridiales bacterium]|nr:sortase B protein-sorting domain-containing protein [Clostridiales bacterium]